MVDLFIHKIFIVELHAIVQKSRDSSASLIDKVLDFDLWLNLYAQPAIKPWLDTTILHFVVYNTFWSRFRNSDQ